MKEKRQRSDDSGNLEIGKIKGLLSNKGVSISDGKDLENLASRGYGTLEDKELTLSSYEALFLQGKGLLDIFRQKSREALDFKDLLHHFGEIDQNVWAKYLIYRDLRSRGYVVREGFGLEIDFRAYERGGYGKATAPYLIMGIQEGKPVTVKMLARVLKHVQSLKKKLVLAVVNRRGEIVYYTLSRLTLEKMAE